MFLIVCFVKFNLHGKTSVSAELSARVAAEPITAQQLIIITNIIIFLFIFAIAAVLDGKIYG
jgi:hypothetical protein